MVFWINTILHNPLNTDDSDQINDQTWKYTIMTCSDKITRYMWMAQKSGPAANSFYNHQNSPCFFAKKAI